MKQLSFLIKLPNGVIKAAVQVSPPRILMDIAVQKVDNEFNMHFLYRFKLRCVSNPPIQDEKNNKSGIFYR